MVVTVLVGLGVWLVAGFLVGAFFGKVVCVTGDPEHGAAAARVVECAVHE